MPRPGVLDDIALQPVQRRIPGPGEVEIEVCALGLSLREVLRALDCYPGDEAGEGGFLTFDGDCAGKIAAVGSNVTEFQIGDEVIAMGWDVFGSFAIVPTCSVVPKHHNLTFEEAATVPGVFVTALYALHHVARIKRGDRILIHSAAGGVGLAAVQLSQRAGAEIFATAGNDEKRQFLRGLGITHVMDSRSFDFVEQTLLATDGKGVDIVLNALSGEFIPKSLSLLAPFGRFLEIGKRDIYDNTALGLYPFRKSLSFTAIDVLQMSPALISSLVQEVMQYFKRGDLKPLHHRVFPISDVVSAFRYMRRANHIGKIVISLGN